MKCPKCKKEIPNNILECPFCKKVISLKCPNCNNLSQTSKCKKCGYIILTKCSKCGKTISTNQEKCKCGFPIKSSIALQECETDEFASLVIKFSALKSIRKLLGSQELFSKFYFKLNNLLTAQFKDIDATIIQYNDVYVINFNKDLSFPTSVNKAIRTALKIINSFTSLNEKIIEELSVPLNLNITIIKKNATELLELPTLQNDIKLLNTKKENKPYLKNLQILLDQFCYDCINKDYSMDSLYSTEYNGLSIMFYEILLENYIIPPNKNSTEINITNIKQQQITKNNHEKEKDIYSFKVFDINAKSKFYKTSATKIFEKFDNNKIISIRSEKELQIPIQNLINYYKNQNKKILRVTCTEELNYKPWGVFETLFKDFKNYSICTSKEQKQDQEQDNLKLYDSIIKLINGKTIKTSTPEDARFLYMEEFSNFFNILKDYVIIIDEFEFLDDTSIQTLELYFDKYKNIIPTFVFITSQEYPVHYKIKKLLRTELYSEYILEKNTIEEILANIKEEASDFINSFFYEKINENFNGSLLYFNNAIKYLIESNILINFENRLLIKNNNSQIIPKNLPELIKSRLKNLNTNQDASLILAYSYYLGSRIDIQTLELLGIKNIKNNLLILKKMELITTDNNVIYINNYHILKSALELSLKKEAETFLCKNILGKIGQYLDDTTTLILLGKLEIFKEEYLLLWKNSKLAMNTGDFDAYLKNCLGSLSLIEYIKTNIPKEELEKNKKEVYENILINLYNYSPSKIYSIENILLKDAFEKNDDEKISKLSNLMLQGALISSNYTDALTLLHNIFTRMEHPVLLVEKTLNIKFFLLSLVNIEILFNIGDFSQCIEVAQDILNVLQPEILEKIKPANFSLNLFIEHLFETFRLVGLAKVLILDDNLEEYFNNIKKALGEELEDKDCIIAIRDFLNGKDFIPTNIEKSSPFAKIIYLILQEFTENKNNYKAFAQNIYQGKLLAAEINQKQLELFCDLLIAYSYANIGINQKAQAIYNDILKTSQNCAIFNINILAKYFNSLLKIKNNNPEEALLLINDTLALLQKYNNQAKVFYVLMEKLFIDIIKKQGITSLNIESEEQKLQTAIPDNKLSRLLN